MGNMLSFQHEDAKAGQWKASHLKHSEGTSFVAGVYYEKATFQRLEVGKTKNEPIRKVILKVILKVIFKASFSK